MMFNINDIKNGMTIKYEGVIYQVVDFQHVKPGKGSAFVKTKLKNLKAGTTQEITFNAGIKMEKADVRKNQLSYLPNHKLEKIILEFNAEYGNVELYQTIGFLTTNLVQKVATSQAYKFKDLGKKCFAFEILDASIIPAILQNL